MWNNGSIVRPTIIAGPCSAESREQVLSTAKALKDVNLGCYRAGIWKPRTQPGEFEGVGVKGLAWMAEARDRYGVRICTEVAKPQHVEACLEFDVDAVWIGARSTTSPFVVQELANALRGTDIPVMIKNPVNPDVRLWLGAVERLRKAGIARVSGIHRGFSVYEQTDYRNRPRWQIVVDFKRVCPDIPMLCDPSHIGGAREHILPISQKAMDMNYDGLMIETHIDPASALTDAAQQVTPEGLRSILDQIVIRSEVSLGTEDRLARLRGEINDLDDELLKVLSRRMRVSGKIGEYKKVNKMTILQSSRWQELLTDHLDKAKMHNISESFISSVFKLIHQESIDIQENVLTRETKYQEVSPK